MTSERNAPVLAIVAEADRLYRDLSLGAVRRWKEAAPGRKAVGYLPVYAPLELVHAAGMLPVGIYGGGDQVEIIRGDACFQSYICHIPRSTVELALSGRLDCLDGMLFPSTCDVIRNLSGIWQLQMPGVYVRYLDVPQDYDSRVGGRFYLGELRSLAEDLGRLSGRAVTDTGLRASIHAFNENRRRVQELYRLRCDSPEKAPTTEVYLLLRAGCVLPVEEHTAMLDAYLAAARASDRPSMDNCRVVLRGGFCEQPPLGLLRTLERAGCDIVDDDFLLVTRWFDEVPEEGDPWEALVESFLHKSVATSSRYIGEEEKGAALVEAVRATRAEGVIFAAASFCDPALLDQPMLVAALDRAGIAHTEFKYAEDTGQFQAIREQAGTFADSIKLWA